MQNNLKGEWDMYTLGCIACVGFVVVIIAVLLDLQEKFIKFSSDLIGIRYKNGKEEVKILCSDGE